MSKEKNPNFKGIWAKYNDYETIKIDNEFYIKPVEKSDWELYDVFDVDKNLLVDLLLMGKSAKDYEKININDTNCDLQSTEKKYQDMVLKFVKKYGLLGELMYIPINNNILHERKVYKQGTNNIETERIRKLFATIF